MSQSDPVHDQRLALSQATHSKSLLTPGGKFIDHPNVAQLPDTLEAAHVLLKEQQAMIDTLSQQLRNTQVRLVEQEQERRQTAHCHEEELRRLEQVQATCQDLRVRLKRQQQQALQFKAALEQCVESCSLQKQSELGDETFAKATLKAVLESTAQSASQERPIQPWSVHALQAVEIAQFCTKQSTDKLAALSGSHSQPRQEPPRSLRRPPSDFAHIDLPTFPRY